MPYVGPAPTPNAPKDLQGGELILDADNDTSITADTDDQIDIKIAGSDEIKITAAMIAPASADGSALGGTSNEWSDLYLADGAVIGLGADQDVTLTHVADTGILLNSTMAIQFNDASQYINAPSNAILDINATDEIELNATLADVNANLDVSGTYTGGGLMTTGGNIVIPDAGNIGSASDTDAIAIASNGVVTFSQSPVFPDGSIAVADLDIDGATDIGAAIVDADLFIVDDGAGGTNRKVTASRLKTYAGVCGKMLQVVSATTTTSTQTSSSSYVDATNLTATITPSASSSKVLILLSLSVFTDSDNNAVGEFKFVRTISGSAADVSNSVFSQISHNNRQSGNHFLMQLDSPNTTSAAAYKVQFFKTDQSGFVEVNRNDNADIARSVITLIEVGA